MEKTGITLGNRAQIGFKMSATEGSLVEIDPTVPDWAKEPTKPRYLYGEILDVPEQITNMELEELINSMGGL